MDNASLTGIVTSSLLSMPLADSYQSEEGDFQDAVRDHLDQVLALYHQTATTTASVGGSNRPRIDLLGTNVWPDIEVCIGDRAMVGIELKLVRQNASLPSGIKEALGQAFLYRLKYPRSIAFVLSAKPENRKLHEFDEKLHDWCEKTGISFILRSYPDKS